MMVKTSPQLKQKIDEVYEEMKRTALWKAEAPNWVQQYQKLPEKELAFTEWLQFVFLPNKVQGNNNIVSTGIAPQAVRFYGKEIGEGRLLQLLVELDSMTE